MLAKFYSLDECYDQDKVFDKLDELLEDSKIDYEVYDDDIIKIKDTGLLFKEKKALLKFFEENDVIEYNDFDEDDDEDDDEDFEDEDDYDDDYF